MDTIEKVEEFWSLAAEEKKDPKAKVRNRGKVIFPAESSNVKDNQDHYPINNADQARNALARSHQYTKTPSWYKGSLSSLQAAVRRKVKAEYPSIEVSEPKKAADLAIEFVVKYGAGLKQP